MGWLLAEWQRGRKRLQEKNIMGNRHSPEVRDLVTVLKMALKLTKDAQEAIRCSGDVMSILAVLHDNLQESIEDWSNSERRKEKDRDLDIGGNPIYPYEKDWKEIVRVNRPLTPHYSEGAYKALLRVMSF
ncbi:MAG: hypothetical protein QMD05_08620 [Candidatus Brocadiaceae bacterium]|nr:hypothetical protein [Candidatus Brocadiaceae bacterium]